MEGGVADKNVLSQARNRCQNINQLFVLKARGVEPERLVVSHYRPARSTILNKVVLQPEREGRCANNVCERERWSEPAAQRRRGPLTQVQEESEYCGLLSDLGSVAYQSLFKKYSYVLRKVDNKHFIPE